ncbi:hypothetical protein NC651_027899 [Populus alba x Populus x berolinensis]|nr:hypothetical protein NC651_027876 [Populus alba x Populus x berolinensis]KAJ6881163.1 hypothetical protein NC651_027883 [Populus alba x Populus x berolinensis]KAJ6881181.1 hypothetical protein NC651_027899 [Populus alba x Populus x berolinensis]
MVYQYAVIVYFYFSIGRLESIKKALYELVILPLQKPVLFSHEKLLGPQKGVLLYGPPGTGKTMLAKAIIREFGAVFINMRISNLMSKWFRDAQKLACDVINPDHIDVEFELIGGIFISSKILLDALLTLQELLQSVYNSITFKILPETEIYLSDFIVNTNLLHA